MPAWLLEGTLVTRNSKHFGPLRGGHAIELYDRHPGEGSKPTPPQEG